VSIPNTPASIAVQPPRALPAAKKPSVPLNVSCLGAAASRVLAKAAMKALRAAMSSGVQPGHLQHKVPCYQSLSYEQC